jgi:hypothetical protein
MSDEPDAVSEAPQTGRIGSAGGGALAAQHGGSTAQPESATRPPESLEAAWWRMWDAR